MMEQLEFTAAAGDTGRLDAWLAAQCPALSRSALQNLIEQGCVTKGAAPVNKKEKVVPGAVYTVELPDPQPIEARPQNIPLDIVYEDDDLLVFNKPADMPCHQSCGHAADTLANVFAAHCDRLGLDLMYRPLNRLDRDTSGAVLVAKNRFAAAKVTNNFHKTYQAILLGCPPQPQGRVDAPIRREFPEEMRRIVAAAGYRAVERDTFYREIG